jgi:hypothetical protein
MGSIRVLVISLSISARHNSRTRVQFWTRTHVTLPILDIHLAWCIGKWFILHHLPEYVGEKVLIAKWKSWKSWVWGPKGDGASRVWGSIWDLILCNFASFCSILMILGYNSIIFRDLSLGEYERWIRESRFLDFFVCCVLYRRLKEFAIGQKKFAIFFFRMLDIDKEWCFV